MKYIVVLGDGMADYPVPELDGKTPLDVAYKPYMDKIVQKGEFGMVKTVKDNISPGSDVANLSVLGYDTDFCYTGRSPLEAVSIGVDLLPDDTSFRANLVTLSDEEDYNKKSMLDYSAGEISTEEARELIASVQKELGNDFLKFYGGISYRHLLVWNGCDKQFNLTPPHDISGKVISDYLPDSDIIYDLMEKSYTILKEHPINKARIARNLNPANSIWVWGQGKKPQLESFEEKYGIKGAVISAVDLIKGIGICAKMDSIDVPGTTGTIHTDFSAKTAAALKALETVDFVYVHLEAPDECGHHFEVKEKIKSIELIDEKVVGPIFEALTAKGEDFSMMVLPDHPTPLTLGTHVRDAVPYGIYRSGDHKNNNVKYNETDCKSGTFVQEGNTLMSYFIG